MASYLIKSITKMGDLIKYNLVLRSNDGYSETQSYAFKPNYDAPTEIHTAELCEVVKHFQDSRDALLVAPTSSDPNATESIVVDPGLPAMPLNSEFMDVEGTMPETTVVTEAPADIAPITRSIKSPSKRTMTTKG